MKQERRLRRKCRTVVIICCLLALVRAADALVPFFHPASWSSWRVSCVHSLCEWRVDLNAMVPPAVQAGEFERRETIEILRKRAQDPEHRAYLVIAELARLVPELLFLFSLARGFLYLGRGEVFAPRTISWLRRAAAAGLLFAAAQMVTVVIQMLVLLPPLYRAKLGNDAAVTVYIPEGEMLAGLFLASAAWAIAFALDAGRRKQDELAGYV